MKRTDIFVIAERWKERRTASGNWSKVKEDYRICRYNRSEFDTFLADKWQGERRSGYTYTRHGYFPTRVTVPNPFDDYRSVTEFTFSDQNGFIELLLDSIED